MMEDKIQKCVGNEGQDIDEWTKDWEELECPNIFYTQMYTTGTGGIGFNRQGYEEVQNQMDSVFDNYVSRLGFQFGIPGESTYNEFQEEIKSVCSDLPGSCNTALATYCHSCPNCSTRESISSNLGTLDFCGCYAPRPNIDIARVTPECDPFCTRIQSIPLPDNKGGKLTCTDNVCVISNISINATKTTTGSGATFEQVCNVCSSGCKCIISSTNINQTLSSIGTSFDQSCGPDSICITTINGQDQVVDCKTSTSGENRSYLILVAVGVIVVIIFIVFFVLFSKKS